VETNLPVEIRMQVDRLKQQLVEEFRGQLDAEEVSKAASIHLETFQDAKIMNFVPVLVYRFTREDLNERSLQASRQQAIAPPSSQAAA
jgi:hypothetical protein